MVSSQILEQNRIFIDASVLFAATLSHRGSAHDLMLAGARDEVILIVSAFVLMETRRNLAKKAPHALPDLDAMLALASLQDIDPSAALVQRVATKVAMKDAPIVAGAAYARARYLATYDQKHLLAHAALIEAQFGIAARTPDAILAAIT
jgi:predicted nucleic acid-binding protein